MSRRFAVSWSWAGENITRSEETPFNVWCIFLLPTILQEIHRGGCVLRHWMTVSRGIGVPGDGEGYEEDVWLTPCQSLFPGELLNGERPLPPVSPRTGELYGVRKQTPPPSSGFRPHPPLVNPLLRLLSSLPTKPALHRELGARPSSRRFTAFTNQIQMGSLPRISSPNGPPIWSVVHNAWCCLLSVCPLVFYLLHPPPTGGPPPPLFYLFCFILFIFNWYQRD